jgi:hypothetical protein
MDVELQFVSWLISRFRVPTPSLEMKIYRREDFLDEKVNVYGLGRISLGACTKLGVCMHCYGS